ncbi:hypothetical protein AQI95_24850 [Streptomyces yokosukanensis]|uniref:Uncharacterized protein n=1 Tax=Streptomyces yokosukanensis TaxID=67386 RepID=A0A117Q116_9ACTN|nr:hypothetical protein [Streptomyces yokosukanensis]KUN02773.1 hypothetical protein AQI95_24850 [Streptomyces yokosukanensis]
MADAVLEQRLIGGVAAILLLFAVVLVVLMVVGLSCCISDAIRRRRREARQKVADAAARGSLYAYLDDCALLDTELSEGFQRLDAAVRDGQKGEQA